MGCGGIRPDPTPDGPIITVPQDSDHPNLRGLSLSTPMSIHALNWALEQDRIDNPGAKFVLLVLCNYADEKGQCWPSRENVAQKTAMSISSVQRHINWLAANGFLTWTNEHTKENRQTPNVYQLPSADFAPREKKPGDKLAHPPEKPSAKIAKAECQMRQKPGDKLAQNTSVRDTSKNTIRELFDFWKSTMKKNGSTLLTPKRERNIADRLKQGYTVDQIKNAIQGNSISPFHNGQNDRKEVFNDIELICRSGEKIEKFEQMWLSRPAAAPKTAFEEELELARRKSLAAREASYVPRNR